MSRLGGKDPRQILIAWDGSRAAIANTNPTSIVQLRALRLAYARSVWLKPDTDSSFPDLREHSSAWDFLIKHLTPSYHRLRRTTYLWFGQTLLRVNASALAPAQSGVLGMSEISGPADAGIDGIVSVSPSRPGPVRKGDATQAPAAGITFVVKKEGKKVTSFKTDTEGHFHVSLPPGHYGGGGDIIGAAYQGMYTPPIIQGDTNGFLCLNYLGDTGISGLGTTVGSASFSFTAAANSNFVIVISTATGSTNSSVFTGTISGFIDNTPGPGPCPAAAPVLTSAVSRLTHAGVGTFDVPMPLTGTTGVEDRQASTYNIVLSFSQAVTSGTASVTAGTGAAGAPTFSGNTMTVPLTGITDSEVVTLTANNVNGALPTASVNLGFLVGDVNADRFTNGGDTIQVRGLSGANVDGTNFRADVNLDGFINGGDTAIVRGESGNSIP